MTYQVKLTAYAKGEIESAYLWHNRYDSNYADSWFRGLMNTIATLQEKPLCCNESKGKCKIIMVNF